MNREPNEVADRELGRALRDLPIPPASEDFFADLRASVMASDKRTEPSQLRGLPPRLRLRIAGLVTAAGLASAVIGASIGGIVSASPACDTVSFSPADGWFTIETTYGDDPGRLPVAWASTVPFAAEDTGQGFPFHTISSLPADGIVITATDPRSYDGGVSFPTLDLPLNVSDGFFVSDDYEGQPAPNVSNFVIDTWVGDRLLNVMVWMGSTEPTDLMKGRADGELASLCVPQP